jgi:hypothetical protein
MTFVDWLHLHWNMRSIVNCSRDSERMYWLDWEIAVVLRTTEAETAVFENEPGRATSLSGDDDNLPLHKYAYPNELPDAIEWFSEFGFTIFANDYQTLTCFISHLWSKIPMWSTASFGPRGLLIDQTDDFPLLGRVSDQLVDSIHPAMLLTPRDVDQLLGKPRAKRGGKRKGNRLRWVLVDGY